MLMYCARLSVLGSPYYAQRCSRWVIFCCFLCHVRLYAWVKIYETTRTVCTWVLCFFYKMHTRWICVWVTSTCTTLLSLPLWTSSESLLSAVLALHEGGLIREETTPMCRTDVSCAGVHILVSPTDQAEWMSGVLTLLPLHCMSGQLISVCVVLPETACTCMLHWWLCNG